MTTDRDGPSSFLTALTEQRELVARRAAAVLASRDLAEGDPPKELRELLALLATSIEELRVVEEEILVQHEDFAARVAEIERRAHHHEIVFKHSPVALLVTDTAGTIRDANAAAGGLLRRQCERLIGKPLSALIPRDERMEFRTALNRLTLTTAVSDWRLELLRPTDTPVRVSVTAQTAPGLFDGLPGIIWTIRPMSEVAAGAGSVSVATTEELTRR